MVSRLVLNLRGVNLTVHGSHLVRFAEVKEGKNVHNIPKPTLTGIGKLGELDGDATEDVVAYLVQGLFVLLKSYEQVKPATAKVKEKMEHIVEDMKEMAHEVDHQVKSCACNVVQAAQSTTSPSQKSSTKLDIHLAFASWVIGAIAMLCVGISKKKTGVHLSLGLWALSSPRTPAFKSLAASSVESILHGEALSAIKGVFSAGGILSPVVLGSIFASIINTAPMTMFYVHSAIVLTGASLFLIREEDRIIRIVADVDAEDSTCAPQEP
ncbi:hypothetical protein M422DRAFT_262379 [Sphaerobolus stellatus SS14]|uniref:Uncharacterized protein n=1 Tax=Sphaerobolus stellatus (strain SS14) TaxID=990650 RepID=A0A0C9UKQ6_SPHS4|nr:hypothetical protein M422DRAFT_262379 [Sphaerobolus stellatus SS14]